MAGQKWLALAVVVSTVALADAQVADEKRVTTLIGQLASDEFRVREAAEKELVAMELAVVGALGRALESRDPEVVMRARLALEKINAKFREKRRELWVAIDQSRDREGATGVTPALPHGSLPDGRGSDGLAIDAEVGRLYRELLGVMPSLEDCRAAIRFFEKMKDRGWDGKKDWENLALAYESMAEVMWRNMHLPVESLVQPAEEEAVEEGKPVIGGRGPMVMVQTDFDWEWKRCRGSAEGWMAQLVHKQRNMAEERLRVLEKLGKLCIEEGKDYRRAARAYETAGRGVPLCEMPLEKLIPQFYPKIMVKAEEVLAVEGDSPAKSLSRHAVMVGGRWPGLMKLSEALEDAGDLRGAIEARTRAMLARLLGERGDWNAYGTAEQTDHFWRLVRQLPAGEALPPMLWLHVLDREHASLEIASPSAGPRVVIRPGEKAAKLTVAAEMETLGGSGGVQCFSMDGSKVVSVGWVGWHKDGRKGKEWREATFDVPEGMGVIRMEITSFNGSNFHVRTIKVTAKFAEK